MIDEAVSSTLLKGMTIWPSGGRVDDEIEVLCKFSEYGCVNVHIACSTYNLVQRGVSSFVHALVGNNVPEPQGSLSLLAQFTPGFDSASRYPVSRPVYA
jgi:hypothetical protein